MPETLIPSELQRQMLPFFEAMTNRLKTGIATVENMETLADTIQELTDTFEPES